MKSSERRSAVLPEVGQQPADGEIGIPQRRLLDRAEFLGFLAFHQLALHLQVLIQGRGLEAADALHAFGLGPFGNVLLQFPISAPA